MEPLEQYGWTADLDEAWKALDQPDAQPGRVIADFGTSLKVALPEIVTAELSGKLAHYTDRQSIPKVGDWVVVKVSPNGHATVESIVPRSSEIARKTAGNQTTKQVIAANVDIAFVLLALDNDFSVDRLRRFLYQLSINDIRPVIVLNKEDKVNDTTPYINQLQSFHLPILTMTAKEGKGVDELLSYIKPGNTAVLLGSSGVGKSTLTNYLLGREAQKTQEIRESDESGRHTTVHRELFMLPNGGLLVDMPGIRELQLWGTEDDLDEQYADIVMLARQCQYTSCRHTTDAGCAIRPALEDGTLDTEHYEAFLKMKAELHSLAERKIVRAKRSNEKSKHTLKKQRRHESREYRNEIDEG